jgi:hypothetical protein
MYANAMRRMEWAGIGNESSSRYYALLKKDLASSLGVEKKRLYEIWLYALNEQKKSYQTSMEMYEQLQALQADYSSRGVSYKQLLYQSDVLLEHSKRCVEALLRLKSGEQADLQQWCSLSQKVERMQELVEKQNGLIRQTMDQIMGK